MPRVCRIFAVFFLSLFAFLIGGGIQEAIQPVPLPSIPRVPGEILAKFNPSANAPGRASARARFQAVELHRFRSGAFHWRLGSGPIPRESGAL